MDSAKILFASSARSPKKVQEDQEGQNEMEMEFDQVHITTDVVSMCEPEPIPGLRSIVQDVKEKMLEPKGKVFPKPSTSGSKAKAFTVDKSSVGNFGSNGKQQKLTKKDAQVRKGTGNGETSAFKTPPSPKKRTYRAILPKPGPGEKPLDLTSGPSSSKKSKVLQNKNEKVDKPFFGSIAPSKPELKHRKHLPAPTSLQLIGLEWIKGCRALKPRPNQLQNLEVESKDKLSEKAFGLNCYFHFTYKNKKEKELNREWKWKTTDTE